LGGVVAWAEALGETGKEREANARSRGTDVGRATGNYRWGISGILTHIKFLAVILRKF